MTRRIKRILAASDYRPWPMPRNRPWVMVMGWRRLLFTHWPVAPELVRPHVPDVLPLDTFDGAAWVGVVPFLMSGVRGRFVPPIPMNSEFLELNVRTYVTRNGRPGVYFFSLDTENPLAVAGARAVYRLPYFRARMSMRPPGVDEPFAAPAREGESAGAWITYESQRIDRRGAPAEFRCRYRPIGPVKTRNETSDLERFLTERLCLYTTDRQGRPLVADIQHPPWPLRTAEAEIELNTMLAPLGELNLDERRPQLLHYADSLDVIAWMIARAR